MSCRCLLSLRTLENRPSLLILPSSPPPLLIPAASFQPGVPGTRTPNFPHLHIAPFGITILPTFTPSCPHTQSLCPIYPAFASAPPARLSLERFFFAGLCSPFRFCGLEPRCSRAEVTALPPAGLGGGGAPAPCALCSYWTGLCVPLSANDGAGGNWRPGPARSRDEAQTVSERLWE